MGINFEEIEELELQREEQVEWWSENGAELGAEERDELFDWIINQGRFHYFELLIELTLDNLNDPPTFAEDLHRIAPQIDSDRAADENASDRAADEHRDSVGPVGGLPEAVPDHVSEIHETIGSFLDGSIDHLGEALSDSLGPDR